MSDEYFLKNIDQQISLIKKINDIITDDEISNKIFSLNNLYGIEISDFENASFNLKTRNIQFYIDEIIDLTVKRLNHENKTNQFKLKKIISDVNKKKEFILTVNRIDDISCDYCDNKRLSFDDELFRFVCKKCNHVNTEVIPSIIEEETKKDDNDTNYTKWKDKIYGRNQCNLEHEKIIKIKKHIENNKYLKRELDHSKIRSIFKELKCSSKDYDYCNAFLSNHYNISSYIPSNKEQNNMDIMYHRIKAINAEIKNDYTNDRYCPYFIYKIVENLFSKEPEKMKGISDFIYIQEYGTVKERDMEWKEICKRYKKQYNDLPIKYKKTYSTAYSI